MQVVFVGAINVGKSSLVARYVKNEVSSGAAWSNSESLGPVNILPTLSLRHPRYPLFRRAHPPLS